MERIKEVRKALGITQSKFAEKLGLVQNTITNYETGRRIPSDQVVLAVCREYGVDENWLRTGKGKMFKESKDSNLDALIEEKGLSDLEVDLVKGYINLPKDMRQYIVNNLERIIGRVPWDDEISATSEPIQKQIRVITNNSDKRKIEMDRAQSILDAQKEIDFQYNNGTKKG